MFEFIEIRIYIYILTYIINLINITFINSSLIIQLIENL